MSLDPDGFIGTLLAIEGIADTRAVMNGPTGCRGNPAYFSDRHFPRENSLNRRSFEEPFFFGQSRIPCTYLDSDDYILGSTDKLREILPLIAQKGDAFMAVVNSPGASLIGDDLNRFLVDAGLNHCCMAFEGAPYSLPLSEGFDQAMADILKWLALNHLPRGKNRVNLLGISLIHKYWQEHVAVLKRLCNMMGLSVVAVPGGGCSVSELRESTTASFNIVVHSEFCKKTTEFFESEFGIPAIFPCSGAPVGFGPTEEWIREIAKVTGCDPTCALDSVKQDRIHAYHRIARYHHEAGYPKGVTFAIRSDASFAYPLASWLYEYLGMIPVSIECIEGSDPAMIEQIRKFLCERGLSSAREQSAKDARADLFFGDGIIGKDLELSGRCRRSVEIYNRTTGEIEFTRKAFLGGDGALHILEKIFDAIRVFP
ncbi:MAG TPA: nitrogenase component 1 [Methanospirillum sp.]|uniref:nitrogenase component 1 n=1 Tax=Methanospirillum sp. TaxID=45200 RepID=UPI002CEFBFD7|nr:nitrogenase component 1 [Methanospirillum sp.]HWQ63381.1 nitrogenase component 1 [Methanospirillum sp.]